MLDLKCVLSKGKVKSRRACNLGSTALTGILLRKSMNDLYQPGPAITPHPHTESFLATSVFSKAEPQVPHD